MPYNDTNDESLDLKLYETSIQICVVAMSCELYRNIDKRNNSQTVTDKEKKTNMTMTC